MRADARSATVEEQAVLARWSGWGAVGQLFDREEFAAERAELQSLLSGDEYAAARRSTINAHYTDAALAITIWDGLARLGFTEGDVLEPGCGSGHFIGLAPPSARMLGVERDPVSAGIAAALYPQAEVITGSFADLDATDGTFDAAVGNVPFAKVRLHDPRHNAGNHSIHNHFIIKALRLTRPGGIVAVLTSRYTLDARNPAARVEIAWLADLVGAVRLPSGAHRRAAGTEAVTDLLILRRREPDTAPLVEASTWARSVPLAVGDAGATVEVNQYFHDHPDHVLGEFTLSHGMHNSEDLAVVGDLNAVAGRFAGVVGQIATDAATRGLGMTPRPAEPLPARPARFVSILDPRAAQFAGFLTAREDGTFTRQVGGIDQPYVPPANQAEELRALLGLRDVAMGLVRAEQGSLEDTAEIRQRRADLNTVYDRYLATYGPVNRFSERRQLRQGWHVFGEWCDRRDLDKLPATSDTIVGYLDDLHRQGLGRDQLQRHLDAIVKAHERAHTRETAKAAAELAEGLARQTDGDVEEITQSLLAARSPESLLASVGKAGFRLDDNTLVAAQAVLADAPEKTSPDLDLDGLGLRTTVIDRPPQGGFRDDPFANVVRALEKFDPTTQSARKADIFTQRVINPPRTRLGADTAEEALSICLDTHSRVDLNEIARLMGLGGPAEARAALGELVYDDPETGEPIWARQYLAGNVRQKAALARLAAEDNPALSVNVRALEQVVPTDLGPEDIEIRLGSWIGPHYVQRFLRELLDDTTVRVEHVAGIWLISNQSKAASVAAQQLWGGGTLNAYELTEKLLVGSEIRVTKDGPGDSKVFDPVATEEAKDKAREISDRFADWVWEDTTRAQELIEIYNNMFNAEIPPDFSGVELSLPGLSRAFTLRPHQLTAVARIIYQPATGLIHEVGAGKTLEMIVGIMERRRRGLATKPVVVVPNDSIAEQFEREWLQAYPGARLLTGTSADLASDKSKGRDGRAEFVARVATGDWDTVIMTKESFQRIPLHPEAQEEFLTAELADLRAEKTANKDTMTETMTKRVETAMENAEERLKKRLDEIDRDVQGVTLRDSGIDFICVDEAQNYKNGLVASALPDLGIPGADRSIDLDMKLAWLADSYGSSRVTLATATPWTGKFSEIYLWLRRLGHQLPSFDTWARSYCTSESFMEMTPGGTLRPKTRMRRVINEPELWRSLRLTSDIKMKADLNLPTPKLRGGAIEILSVPAPVEARIYTLDLARRERNLKGPPEKGADNHLVIQHDGQLCALDVRCVGLQTDAPQKVDVVADDIHTEWSLARDNVYYRDDGTEHPVRGGLILVFCDESTPGKGWNLYTELKQQLISRGMPEESIRFIHEATSPQRKTDLLAACREGAVSVLIGSTMKMGAGLNVQTRAIGGYELTGQWRPDITAQAKGRVERQGNQNPEFFWKRVVLSPSMDAKKWEITAQKHNMFAPLYASTPPARTREVTDDDAVSLADVMAAATGDPRYREKAELDQEHKSLIRQRSAHVRTQQSLKLTVTSLTEWIPQREARAARQELTAAQRVDTRGDAFRMTIGNRTYDRRGDAAEALKTLLVTRLAAAPRTREGQTITVGAIGGYTLTATLWPLSDLGIHLNFPEASECVGGLALDAQDLPERHGLITRLENQLDVITGAAAATREQIEHDRHELAQARSGLDKPFPHEQRLAEVTLRRTALITELTGEPDIPYDPNEPPDSPQAKARAERAAARQRDIAELMTAAQNTAQQVGLHRDSATRFADWFLAIALPVTPEQRPPLDAALAVWFDLDAPNGAGHQSRPRYTTNQDPDSVATEPPAIPTVPDISAPATHDARDDVALTPARATQAEKAADHPPENDRPTASSLDPMPPDPGRNLVTPRNDGLQANPEPGTLQPGKPALTTSSAQPLEGDRPPDADEPGQPFTGDSATNEALAGEVGNRGHTVLASLDASDTAERWVALDRELAAAGYSHQRRDHAELGEVEHDQRIVVTDSGWTTDDELVALAAHVAEVRQHLNTARATETVDAVLAAQQDNDTGNRLDYLRQLRDAGISGTAARWAGELLAETVALRHIAQAVAEHPDAPLTRRGSPVTTDAQLPTSAATHDPDILTCGDVRITLLVGPGTREAGIASARSPRSSVWIRLPSSGGESTSAVEAILAAIHTANDAAAERRSRIITELALTQPATPAAPPGRTERAIPTAADAVSVDSALDPMATPEVRRTVEAAHKELAAASFAHRRRAGVGASGELDMAARTVTTDPELPARTEAACLADLTNQVHTRRQQLAEQTRSAVLAADPDRPDAERGSTALTRAAHLDALGRALATATSDDGAYFIPAPVISTLLRDGQIEQALLGFARAAHNGTTPREALAGTNILVRSDQLTWRGITITFTHTDSGVQATLVGGESGRDIVPLDEPWLRREDGGTPIRAAIEHAVASAAARADTLRRELLAQYAAPDTRISPWPTSPPQQPAATASGPVDVPRADRIGSDGRVIQIQERRMGADAVAATAWSTVDQAIEHLTNLPVPAGDTHQTTPAWGRERDQLVEHLRVARRKMLSPSGALVAYKVRSDRLKRQCWYVVHVASGHQIGLLRHYRDVWPSEIPSPALAGSEFTLPDSALTSYLDALERLVDPTGQQVDWSVDYPQLLHELANWHDLQPDGTHPDMQQRSPGVGMRSLHTAAVFHITAGTRNRLDIAACSDFGMAVALICPDPDSLWGRRHAGRVVREFQESDIALTGEFHRPPDARQNPALHAVDRETATVLALAQAHAFGGEPHAAVALLQRRLAELETLEADRNVRYSTIHTRRMIPLLVELATPTETEAERLAAVEVGAHLAEVGSVHGDHSEPVTVWRVTKPPVLRQTGPDGLVSWNVGVALLHPDGPIHGTLTVTLTQESNSLRIQYDQHQPEHHGRYQRRAQTLGPAIGRWAVIDAGQPVPDTNDAIDVLSRRAERAFHAVSPGVIGERRPEAIATHTGAVSTQDSHGLGAASRGEPVGGAATASVAVPADNTEHDGGRENLFDVMQEVVGDDLVIGGVVHSSAEWELVDGEVVRRGSTPDDLDDETVAWWELSDIITSLGDMASDPDLMSFDNETPQQFHDRNVGLADRAAELVAAYPHLRFRLSQTDQALLASLPSNAATDLASQPGASGDVPDMAAAALAWRDAGCSVIRVATDGTKASLGEWTRYQHQRTPRDQVAAWFSHGHPGIGIVCGAVSGDLEMFELEGRAVAEKLDEGLRDQLTASGNADLWRRLTEGYLEQSPSGGLHLLYRVDGGVDRNTKLARREAHDDELTDDEQQRLHDKGKRAQRVLLETRGERGMVVVAPSHGPVHETGRPWQIVAGSPASIPTITAAERDALHMAARSLDQLPPPAPIPDPVVRAGQQRSADGLLPGTDFNERGTWEQVLAPHGWEIVGRDTLRGYWRRPGKTRGISATTGGTAGDYLYVFSTSTELPSEQAMSKWRVYALLNHAGDFSAAAKALRAAGYGDTTPAPVPRTARRPPEHRAGPTISPGHAAETAQPPPDTPTATPPGAEPVAPQPDEPSSWPPEPGTADTTAETGTRAGTRDMATQTPPATVEAAEPPSAIGVWSLRIQVDESTTGVIVSGTDRARDPEQLRQALKDNKFRWRPQRGAWEHTGRAADRAPAAQAIRELLAELDHREAARTDASHSYPPTPQQQAIIDAALSGVDVAVLALAGTGKTSTLRMLAHAMPEKRIIYIAFNRSIADEAQKAFPRHVTANTMHSFALRALRDGPHAGLLEKLRASGARLPKDVAPVLGLTAPIVLGRQQHEPDAVARLTMATVEQFRNSADDTIEPRHLPTGVAENRALAQIVLDHANRAWADIVSPTGRLVFTHDDYLKIWALTKPRLNADVVYFDEAQDINDLQRQVILDQRTRPDESRGAQIIVVGDSYQSIYGFRGAKDALQTWPAETRLPLTQSWRFGPAIAEVGNKFLALLRAELELEGNPSLDSRIEPVSTPDAVLCRTNAGAVTAVFDAHADGRRVALVGGGQAIKDIARAALDLQRGRRTRHPDLAAFSDWSEVRDAANTEQAAKHLQPFVRLVDRHGANALIDMANALVSEDDPNPDTGPQIVVSTAHKAKGREWNRVRIAEDFRGPTEDDDGNTVLPAPEELRLCYVTATRAKKILELGSLGWIRDYLANTASSQESQLSATPTPARAPQPLAPAANQPGDTDPTPIRTGDPNPEPDAIGTAGRSSTSDEPNPATAPSSESVDLVDTVMQVSVDTATEAVDEGHAHEVAEHEPADATTETEGFSVPADAVASVDAVVAWANALGQDRSIRSGRVGALGPRDHALGVLRHVLGSRDNPRAAVQHAHQIIRDDNGPLETVAYLEHVAAAIDRTCATTSTPREHFGRYPQATLTEHLREVVHRVTVIAEDPAAVARVRAAAWIPLIEPNRLRDAHRRVADGELRAAREFLGVVLPIPYRQLVDGRARVIVQDLFVAAARRERVDIVDRGTAESGRRGREDTAVALWALAVELGDRAHRPGADDATAQALRDCRIDVIIAQADGIARHMASIGEFSLPSLQPPGLGAQSPVNAAPEETDPKQATLFDDLLEVSSGAGEPVVEAGTPVAASPHPSSPTPGSGSTTGAPPEESDAVATDQPGQAIFEHAVSLAERALAETEAAGGHNPNAWLEFSELVRTDPATGISYSATQPELGPVAAWWSERATEALAALGYQVEARRAAGRRRYRDHQIEVDEAARLVIVDAAQFTGTTAHNLVQQVAAQRRLAATAATSSAKDRAPEPTIEEEENTSAPVPPEGRDEPTNVADAPDPGEPGTDEILADEGYTLIDGLTGIPEVFRAQHWSLMEEQPAEIGGIHAEHWRRHDVSIAVHLTPEDRVLTAVFIRHGPWESAAWEELDIHSAELLRDLIGQAGLNGVAHPARLPGLWRITIAELAVDATDAADADSDARLVTRLADAPDEDAWTFADDGAPVPLAPPLPEIPVTNRNDVVKYVLGDHSDDKQARDLVSVVISGRARNGITSSDAPRMLSDIDQELYRRAITAAAGRGQPFDVDRARQALERLAEGDPALPLNSIGQRVQLDEPDTAGKPRTDTTSASTDPRHGVVVDVIPHASNLLRVTVNRDAGTDHDTEHVQLDVPIDAVLTLHDPADDAASTESSAHAVAPPTASPETKTRRGEQPAPAPTDDAAQSHQVGLFDVDIPPTSSADPVSRRPAGAIATAEAPTEDDSADRPASMAGGDDPGTAHGDHETHRAPLTDHDIAIALGRALQGRMSEFIHAMGTSEVSLAPSLVETYDAIRTVDEPDPGAEERVEAGPRGLEITVRTPTELRTGLRSWKSLAQWLRAGLEPADLCLLHAAAATHHDFSVHWLGFVAIDQASLAAAALDELATLREEVADRVLDSALHAHSSGNAPKPWRGKVSDPLLRVAAETELAPQQRAQLARITALRAVLPAQRDEMVALTDVTSSDIVLHPTHPGRPLRITATADRGDAIELTGELLNDPRQPIPDRPQGAVALTIDKREPGGESAVINRLIVPQSLSTLVVADGAEKPGTVPADFPAELDSSATPNPLSTETDGPANPSEAGAGTASDEVVQPAEDTELQPLTHSDVAVTLRRMRREVADLVRLTTDKNAIQALPSMIWGERTWRREDEPDPGASVELDVDRKGVTVTVGFRRTGRWTWPQLAEWLRPGITPTRAHVLQTAYDAERAYHRHREGFLATGELTLARQADAEITAVFRAAVADIVNAAEHAHPAGPATPLRRQRRAASDPSLLDLGESVLDPGTQSVIDRLAALTAVLPTDRLLKPLAQLQPGDVLASSNGSEPIRLTQPPVDHGDRVDLVGIKMRERHPDTEVRFARHRYDDGDPDADRDPHIELVALPKSLAHLVSGDQSDVPATTTDHQQANDPSDPQPAQLDQTDTSVNEAAPNGSHHTTTHRLPVEPRPSPVTAVEALSLVPANDPLAPPLADQLAIEHHRELLRDDEPSRLALSYLHQLLDSGGDLNFMAQTVLNVAFHGEATLVSDRMTQLAHRLDAAGYTDPIAGTDTPISTGLREIAQRIQQKLPTATTSNTRHQDANRTNDRNPGASATIPPSPRQSAAGIANTPKTAGAANDKPEPSPAALRPKDNERTPVVSDPQHPVDPAGPEREPGADRPAAGGQDQAPIGAPSPPQPTATVDSTVRTEKQHGTSSPHSPEPEPSLASRLAPESTAERWTRLVDRASRAGYTVQTRDPGTSALDADSRTIWIAFDQDPHLRIVDLVELITQLDGAERGPSATPPPAAVTDEPQTPAVPPTPVQPTPASPSETPIFDEMARTLEWPHPAADSTTRQTDQHDDHEQETLAAVFASLNAKLRATANRADPATRNTSAVPAQPTGMPDNLIAVFTSLTTKLRTAANGADNQLPHRIPTEPPRTRLGPGDTTARRQALVPVGVEADRTTGVPTTSTRHGERVPSGRERAAR